MAINTGELILASDIASLGGGGVSSSTLEAVYRNQPNLISYKSETSWITEWSSSSDNGLVTILNSNGNTAVNAEEASLTNFLVKRSNSSLFVEMNCIAKIPSNVTVYGLELCVPWVCLYQIPSYWYTGTSENFTLTTPAGALIYVNGTKYANKTTSYYGSQSGYDFYLGAYGTTAMGTLQAGTHHLRLRLAWSSESGWRDWRAAGVL